MIIKTLFRSWWMILIQGILMIGLSILVFKNPDTVLATVALWLGLVVLLSGLVGVLAWFMNSKEHRSFTALMGSVAMLLIGILMISKIILTIKAITLVFGFLTALIGIVVLSGAWNSRKQWSLWWIIALFGLGALVAGTKSMVDIYDGTKSISNLMGIAILLSGIGLIFLSLVKRKIVMAINN